ncbi:MAG: 4-hydroxythreonine-4-phosphate dehydrogenase PdxA [Myxococcales bacterium]
MNASFPLAVPVGDPAGVGPMVAVQAALQLFESVPIALFGDAQQLASLADAHGLPAQRLDAGALTSLEPGRVGLIHTGSVAEEIIQCRAPSAEGGRQQLAALAAATVAVRAGRARAIVTGPTSKAAIVSAGQPFVGQTEYLAKASGLADDAVTMMFLGPKLRVALVTTHLAVADLPRAITGARVARTVRHLGEALLRLYPRSPRRLTVVGLNPHAGEGGLFGREEIEVIEPALRSSAMEPAFASGELVLKGPEPAESVFRAAQRGDIEGVVAMFHDQATLASKLLDWGAAVNTTWGLPFVRTSVDHGVAYDAARANQADADGMLAAMHMALRLTQGSDVG